MFYDFRQCSVFYNFKQWLLNMVPILILSIKTRNQAFSICGYLQRFSRSEHLDQFRTSIRRSQSSYAEFASAGNIKTYIFSNYVFVLTSVSLLSTVYVFHSWNPAVVCIIFRYEYLRLIFRHNTHIKYVCYGETESGPNFTNLITVSSTIFKTIHFIELY